MSDIWDLHIPMGLKKPETAAEVKEQNTLNGMRAAIERGQRDSALIRNALNTARYQGWSGEDTYVFLAYHALRMLEDQWERNLEWSRLSPMPSPILVKKDPL